MRFEIIKNSIRQKSLQTKAVKNYQDSKKEGKVVKYEMPTLPELFPKLRQSIFESKHRERFYNIGYYIETKNSYIISYIPAAEYHKLTFRAIADKFYSLSLSVDRVKHLKLEIQEIYRLKREIVAGTKQPSFSVDHQVYTLKSEITNILFTIRSILDSFATMLHFLYGANSRQFISFADFLKYLEKEKPEPKETIDNEMKQYANENMKWFFVLRDLRDYVAHCSSIDIQFYENDSGLLQIIIQDRFEIDELLNPIISGLEKLFLFFDNHFANRINADVI